MRKWGAGASTILLFAAVLAACGKTGGTTDGGGQAAQPAQPEAKKEPVELVFYYPSGADWTEETFMQTFGDPIKKKFPHITPKFMQYGKGTALPELLAAQQQIDVFYGSTGQSAQLETNQIQYDITPLIQTYKFDLSVYNPALIDTAKELGHGAIYGLPVYGAPAVMYYNKDVFDKFGVPYPKDGMTWDDIYEVSKKTTRLDGNVQYLGLTASVGHLAQLNQLTLTIVDPKTEQANMLTDPWKSFGDNISRFFTLPGYDHVKGALDVANQRKAFFADRRAAIWLALTGLHKQPELTEDMKFDLAAFPAFKEAPGAGPQAYPSFFNIPSISKHKDDAFQAIAYLASEEFQMQAAKTGAILPVLKKNEIIQAFGQDSPLYKGKNVKALIPQQYAKPSPLTTYNGNVTTGFYNAILDHVLNGKDLNTALREQTEEANKKIQTAKSK